MPAKHRTGGELTLKPTSAQSASLHLPMAKSHRIPIGSPPGSASSVCSFLLLTAYFLTNRFVRLDLPETTICVLQRCRVVTLHYHCIPPRTSTPPAALPGNSGEFLALISERTTRYLPLSSFDKWSTMIELSYLAPQRLASTLTVFDPTTVKRSFSSQVCLVRSVEPLVSAQQRTEPQSSASTPNRLEIGRQPGIL